MRVLMYYNNRDVRVEEMPVPKIGYGELLLKVVASGICGSFQMQDQSLVVELTHLRYVA